MPRRLSLQRSGLLPYIASNSVRASSRSSRLDFARQLGRERAASIRGTRPGVHQEIAARLVEHARAAGLTAIRAAASRSRRLEHGFERVAVLVLALRAVRQRQQVQVVVAQHHVALAPSERTKRSVSSDCGPRLTRSPTNHSWSRSAEKLQRCEQRLQLVAAALDVADGVAGHEWPASSVQHARHREPERRDRRVELLAVVRDHLVAALHGADGRLEHGAARIAEALARA